MSDVTVEMCCCTEVILNDIAHGLPQKEVAKSYALALRSSWPTDWLKVNTAIIERWSKSGLNRIKEMAWSGKCFDDAGKTQA